MGPATLVLFLLLIAASSLRAAPFAEEIQFVQPDGTAVTIWGEGDEFHAVFETLEGYTVVFDPAHKAYCYARLSADGTELVSTGVLVHEATGESLGLPSHLRVTPESARLKAAARREQWEAGMEIAPRWSALKARQRAVEAEGPAYAPPGSTTVGTKVGLCLLIDFDDDPATIAQTNIVAFLNGDNYTAYSNNGSVKKYFQDVSNGLLTYSNVVTLYVRIPNSLHPKSWYNDTTKDGGEQGNLLIKDALDILKALPNYETDILPAFSGLTTDSQNRVIACNVFYAGGNGGVWSMGLWPHSWSLVRVGAQELSPGGKKIYRYQITNIGSSLKIGTFCHENGHMLCGFPDIYDYDYDSKGGAGVFCLMNSGSSGGNPSQVCAYLKRAAGWAAVTELTSASNLVATVTATPGPEFNHFYRYRNPGVATEYFLMECRYKTNRDSALPASGVAIWHIDELGDKNNQSLTPNTQHKNYECTLVQADNKWDFQKNVNSGDNYDLYHSGNTAAAYNNTFTDTSTPNAHWWDGSSSGLNLHHFSARAPSMTFLVGTVQMAPLITSQPADQEVREGTNVTLSVGVSGLPPLRYQWRKAGLTLAGATDSVYSIATVLPAHAGVYSVLVTNAYGSALSSNAVLSVIPLVSLPEALDATNLNWTTEGNAPWGGQVQITHDSVDAAQSGTIGNNQQSRVQTVVPGPGALSFWWKVSSETNADYARFRLGGAEQAAISGETDWRRVSVEIPPGYQTLEWAYTKNASGAAGSDRAWLDEVLFTAIPMPPVILAHPAAKAVLRGSPVTFSVTATGSPELGYQWQFRGCDIADATASEYSVPSAAEADAGAYAVRVHNLHGSVWSSNAILGLTYIGTAGDSSFGQGNVGTGASNIVTLAAGAWHNLGLAADGRVIAWGNNWDGQCNVPDSLHNAIAVAAGGYHNLAIRADGSVAAWGANPDQQIDVPANLGPALAVAAGLWHSLVLLENGHVVAWGDNSSGQTGVPPGLSNVIAIAAGGNHSLALRSDGTVAAWGANTDAQGYWSGQSLVPPGLAGVVAVAAGEYHSLALKADGTVAGWGDNLQGQAQPPAGLSEVVAIAAGGQHSLALRRDGSVVAWGNNWNGQCNVAVGQPVDAIAAGSYHTQLLLSDGVSRTRLLRAGPRGSSFGVLIQTTARDRYALQHADEPAAVSWTELPALNGTGALLLLTDPNPSAAQRFYRVKRF